MKNWTLLVWNEQENHWIEWETFGNKDQALIAQQQLARWNNINKIVEHSI